MSDLPYNPRNSQAGGSSNPSGQADAGSFAARTQDYHASFAARKPAAIDGRRLPGQNTHEGQAQRIASYPPKDAEPWNPSMMTSNWTPRSNPPLSPRASQMTFPRRRSKQSDNSPLQGSSGTAAKNVATAEETVQPSIESQQPSLTTPSLPPQETQPLEAELDPLAAVLPDLPDLSFLTNDLPRIPIHDIQKRATWYVRVSDLEAAVRQAYIFGESRGRDATLKAMSEMGLSAGMYPWDPAQGYVNTRDSSSGAVSNAEQMPVPSYPATSSDSQPLAQSLPNQDQWVNPQGPPYTGQQYTGDVGNQGSAAQYRQ